MKSLPSAFLLIPLLFLALVPPSTADDKRRATGAPTDVGRIDHGPRITTTLPASGVLTVGYNTFDVTVADPDGDRVSLCMSAVPYGLVMEPIVDVPSPATVTVRWQRLVGNDLHFAREKLVFLAKSRGKTVRHVVEVRLESPFSGYEFADVTGDGVTDVIAGSSYTDVNGISDTGAIYVWSGTSTGGAPDATLTVPGALTQDRLISDGLELVDITGDGIQDILAFSRVSSVWIGGPALTGTLAPDATFSAPDNQGPDGLASPVFDDFTGDGIVDVLAANSYANVNNTVNAGAVFLYAGAPSLSGAVPPTATLFVPGTTMYAGLGRQLYCADVTGDGIPDILAGASLERALGIYHRSGAIYTWQGGQALSGMVPPDAMLYVPQQDVRVPLVSMELVDTNDDGILDVVVANPYVDSNTQIHVGEMWIWRGRPALSGSLPPDATVRLATQNGHDIFALTTFLADVTGDGVLDSVANSIGYDSGGQTNVGMVAVHSGTSLSSSGTKFPTARLTVPGAHAGDRLSNAFLGVADVSGDGVLDVIAASNEADVGGVTDTGALYVWHGGPELTGNRAPTATLTVPGAMAGDELGRSRVRIDDVNGDGWPDIVTGSEIVDVAGVMNAGAVYVWYGGPSLVGSLPPSATLTVPAPLPYDSLGRGDGSIQLADVTADGVADVVVAASVADVGATNTGAVYVWPGGSALVGAVSPFLTLSPPGATGGESLGATQQPTEGCFIEDVNLDGDLDIVAVSTGSTVIGAIHIWHGGAGLNGTVSSTLYDPAGVVADFRRLGIGPALRIVDLEDDGLPDIFYGAPGATVSGVLGAGALYSWKNGTAWSGPTAPTWKLTVPSAVQADRLTMR